MWRLYENDESFQIMAKEKVTHDGQLLEKVLYGKEAKHIKYENQGQKKKKEKKGNLRFSFQKGSFSVDASLLGDEESGNMKYVSRTKDYKFLPVKTQEDLHHGDLACVRTDVVVFDRHTTSEFNEEKEDLKDDLVAWEERSKCRKDQRQSENADTQMKDKKENSSYISSIYVCP